MTGLAAGMASGFPVYEATDAPGGICSSYYMRPEGGVRLHTPPSDEEAYRFEIGGGHWIFGGDASVLSMIRSLAPARVYNRRSSVYFACKDLFVPYPIQNHLRFLGPDVAARALAEMIDGEFSRRRVATLAEWLDAKFGRTLCDLFFDPFHRLYTAGLWREIAPQDPYKSPVDLRLAVRGAFGDVDSVGYNTTFIYPRDGLNRLAEQMALRCDIRYGKRVVAIDTVAREVQFEDGDGARYDKILSTLPLNRMLALSGLEVGCRPHPAPSVLVLNIGAIRAERCPADHWVYIPSSDSGFHRVGFYSNVDRSFLPASARSTGSRVSIYVERAYPEGCRPDAETVRRFGTSVVEELQRWGWIGAVDVVDPTWIDVAYTWSWPESDWRERALAELDRRSIRQVGRYARWVFQGIAESIRDGLLAGSALAQEVGSGEARTLDGFRMT